MSDPGAGATPDGGGPRLRAVRGDITTLEVDAIVNAANERMLGGGGVDGAIHRAAGPELLDACRAVAEVRPGVRCPTGEARITPGFRLPARFVVHTVGPRWHGGTRGEADLLASCYRRSLALATDHGARTVAFPAISCGVYGYPPGAAAAIAAGEVAGFLADHDELREVLLVAFDDALLEVLEKAVADARDRLAG
jgi:O-acetyl-ADP-ribose deacetylase (regulator of RNase III)